MMEKTETAQTDQASARRSRLVGILGATLVRMLFSTSRMEEYPQPLFKTLNHYGRPFIGAFWHSRLLYMPYYFGSPDHSAIISRHKDGEIAAQIVKQLGVQVVRGSTTRGGSDALRKLVSLLKKGVTVGITPDGPKGPPRRFQIGAILLSQLSGRPIIPLAYSVRRRLILQSWDSFVVPAPFNRGIFVHGEPVFISRNLDEPERDQIRQRVEQSLNEITDFADRQMGWKARLARGGINP